MKKGLRFVELWREGKTEEALRVAREYYESLLREGQLLEAVQAFMWLEKLLRITGREHLAKRLEAELEKKVISDKYAYNMFLLRRQHMLAEEANVREAAKNLKKMLQICPEEHITEAKVLLTFLQGDMRRLAEVGESSTNPYVRLYLAKALAYQGCLEEAEGVARAVKVVYPLNFLQELVMAVVLALRGEESAAIRELSSVVEKSRRMHPLLGLEEALVLLGLLWLKQGDEDKGRVYLELAESSSLYQRNFLWFMVARVLAASLRPSGEAERLIRDTLKKAEEEGYGLVKLIATLALAKVLEEQGLQGESQKLLQKVSDFAWEKGLGGLETLVKDALFHRSESSQPRLLLLGTWGLEHRGRVVSLKKDKTLELLAYIAMNQGRLITREEAIDALWPEKEPELAMRNLYRHLSLARALLEEMGVRVQRKRPRDRVSLGAVLRVDAVDFASLVSTGKALAESGQEERATPFLERAVSLYGGPFMPGSKVPWAVEVRRELEAKFKEAQELLSRLS